MIGRCLLLGTSHLPKKKWGDHFGQVLHKNGQNPNAARPLTKATVCQKCGVKGYEQLLVFCDKCQLSAEHRYCLDGPITEEEVKWLCEQCITRVPKNDGPHANITTRRKKYALRHRCRKSRPIKVHHLRKSFITKASTDVDEPLNGTSSCLKKDVLNVATINESKPVDIKQEDLSSHAEKNGVHLGIEKSECLGNEGEGSKMKKKRKLILDDESDEDAPPVPLDDFIDGILYRSITQDKLHLPSHPDYSICTIQPDKPLPESAAECYSYFPVSPIVRPVWRGYFNVCDRKYGPAVAHLSNGACEKAYDAADMLPQVLHFESLPRLEAWPKGFECSGPTKNNIALYFFPGGVRAKAVFEQLLRDVIKKDLTLKVTVHKAELLVFPSMLLPPQSHLFEGEPYLWGVFRRQQDSRLPMPPDTHCPRLAEAARQVDEDQQYNIYEDASTKCLNDDVKGDTDNKEFNEPQTPGGDASYVSWGSRSQGHLASDRYCSRLNKVTGNPLRESKAACWTGSTLSEHLSTESSHFIEIMNKPEMGTLNSNMEFNLSGEYQGDELAACLELFPLGTEDLGMTGNLQDGNEVDIELGLDTVKDRKYEYKPASEEPAILLFGKEIF